MLGVELRDGPPTENAAPDRFVIPSDLPMAKPSPGCRGGSQVRAIREAWDDPSTLSKRGRDEAETSSCAAWMRWSQASLTNECNGAGGTSSLGMAPVVSRLSSNGSAASTWRLAPTLE